MLKIVRINPPDALGVLLVRFRAVCRLRAPGRQSETIVFPRHILRGLPRSLPPLVLVYMSIRRVNHAHFNRSAPIV